MSLLQITNLHASVDGNEILKGVDLTIEPGSVHSIMGPNGSGKSTLARVIAGHEDYEITDGDILFDGKSILDMDADERAREGLFMAFQRPTAIPGVKMADFLRHAATNVRRPDRKEGEELIPMRQFRKELCMAFQYPVEIPGVSNTEFLKAALNAKRKHDGLEPLNAVEFLKLTREKMKSVDMPADLLKRSVNEGFSGGEKKRHEVFQMALLEPRMCVLDETDSGLDIDALRIVADGVNAMRDDDRGFLVITHYQRLLDYIVPDYVHVLVDGRIAKSGGKELAVELEHKGYSWVTESEPTPA